jgi:hypothetical protein
MDMHPAISEIRQLEMSLTRVVSGVQTMEVPVKNPVKQRAAQSRWRSHNLQRGLTAAETPGG